MKKQFLLLAAVFSAAVASAQVLQINAGDQGYTSDVIDVADNTPLGSNDAIDLSIAFAEQVKATDCKGNAFNEVVFDGNSLYTSGGVTGSNNPKDIDGGNPAQTLTKPASGFVLQITAKQDGYAYVMGKLSSNKNYFVFEEGTAIGYDFWMEVVDDRVPGKVISFTAEGDGTELNYIVDAAQLEWPIRRYMNSADATTAGNGVGVIGFPIYTGCTYLVGAGGSKISCAGVYTSTSEVASIVAKDADGNTLTLYSADPTGIENVAVAEKADVNAPVYNLAGQQVSKAYKGVVIQNGKKFIQK